jgi:hypothetical protein
VAAGLISGEYALTASDANQAVEQLVRNFIAAGLMRVASPTA